MSNIPELPEDYRSQLAQIDEHQLRIMWHCGWYDGPLSGVIAYKDKSHWFESLWQDDEIRTYVDDHGVEWQEWYKRFLLLELSEKQYQEELYWYNLFREKVGTYWDYDESGNRKRDGSFKPREMHSEYYDAAKNRKPRDFTNNVIVGWFEWHWASVEADELDN
ncbi:MAG: hypothetical protein K8L99_02550 [Anaerolineae bacterium]|nr:hypothetical protein [Anaerolineae bacterium]